MKKYSPWKIIFFSSLLATPVIQAQNIGINTSGTVANTSAILDLNTGNTYSSPNGKGLLIPNVALTGINDATTIASPATSLLVYVPSGSGLSPAGYYFNSGTPVSPVWTSFSSGMSGTGTLNYLARWTPNGTTLGIGASQDNGSVAVIQQGAATFGTITELTVNANTTETNAILGATTIANGTGVTGSNTQITGTSTGITGSIGTYIAPAWGAVGVYGSADNNTTYGVEGNNPSGDPTGGAGVIGYDYSGTGVIGSNDLITQIGFYHGPHGTGGNFFSAYNGLVGSYNMTGAGGTGILGMGYNSGGPINPNSGYGNDFGILGDFGGSAGGAGDGAAVGGFIGNTSIPAYYAAVLGASNATDYGVLGYNTLATGYALAAINSTGITGNGLYVNGISYMAGKTGIFTNNPNQALEIGLTTNTARIDGLAGTGTVYNQPSATNAGNLVYANNTNGDLWSIPAPSAASVLSATAAGVVSWQTGSVFGGTGTTNYYARWTPNGTTLGVGLTEDNGTSVSISNPASAPVNNTMLTVTANATSGNAIVGTTTAATGSGVWGIGTGTNTGGVTGSAGGSGTTEVGVYANNYATGAGIEYALVALKNGNTVTGTGYAVYGIASGTAATNYAGYFSASGGTTNYGVIVPSTGGNSGFGTITPAQIVEAGGNANTARIDGLASAGTVYNQASATNAGNLVYANKTNGDLWSIPAPSTASILSATAAGVVSWQTGSVFSGSGINNYLARWTPNGTTLSTGVTEDNGASVSMNTTATAPVASQMLTVTANATATTAIVGTTTAAGAAGVVGSISSSPANGYGIKGLNTTTTGGGNQYAVYGASTAASGNSYGVYGSAAAGATVNYGGYFTATAGTTNNYGVYSTITGIAGSTNYAGYFSGSGSGTNYGIVVPSTGGNSGFGTTAPGNKLAVSTTTANDGEILSNGTAWTLLTPGTVGSGSFNGITTSGDNGIFFSNGTIGTGNFVIAPWATGTTGIRMLGSNGYVGMGVAVPTWPLDVQNSTTIGIRYYKTSGGKDARINIIDNSGAQTGGWSWSVGWATGGDFSLIQEGLYGNVFYASHTNQYVGIYTSTPKNTFDVAGNMAIGAYGGVNTAPADGLIVSGNVGIGCNSPFYNLDVNGNIRASGSVYYGGTACTNAGTAYAKPDYVFEPDYKKSFDPIEIEKFITANGHLPWVTSAADDQKENNGAIDMTRMSFQTLEAVENTQTQIIEQQKMILGQQNKVDTQQAEIDALKKENDVLKQQLAELTDKVNQVLNKQK